jgi:serine/threonine-protein kinase
MEEEVSALKALSNGVPKLFDANLHDDSESEQPFFVMEWIPGPILAEQLSGGVMSIDEALACTRTIIDTLQGMHRLPLVHRDLKPDNIILRDSVPIDPVIIDLGLAWSDSGEDRGFVTDRGQEMGNRFLRLPEFAPGQANRDARSDVTLVAGLLLYMLTGRAPCVSMT